MENSRIERKQKSSQLLYKKGALILSGTALFGSLIAAWYLNYKLTFTILTVIIFFGILCFKPDLYKNYLPGLNSSNIAIRILSSILYVLIVIAIVSQVGLIEN
ncbi:hypothetical protein HA075_11705 [bacterium BFN5]|nr:hypothetical protein HA075_11590 [bacterium BFN5]QJW46432.1 hypothetical protein HA075_11705 [bacterium BFN5]